MLPCEELIPADATASGDRDPRIGEYCGLFGIFGTPDAALLTTRGLYAQQHRGQEAAGICVGRGGGLHLHAAAGLVTEVFTPDRIASLPGEHAIGHVRYSTTGSSTERNVQPMLINYAQGQVAVAHNGNLVNAVALRERYERRGAIFRSSCDTEVILHLLADPRFSEQNDPLPAVLNELRGAFCLLFIFPDRIEAARDPYGLRPLCIGRLPEGGAYIVASETCALDMVEADYVRDVAPGEIVTLSVAGLSSRWIAPPGSVRPAHCIFEQVYFADPSSDVFGQNVHAFRAATGRRLAVESPADADVCIAVPNCARCAAQGFAQQSGVPLGRGFTVSHYAGRSFIKPTQAERDLTVRMKLNVIKETVRGRRVAVIEDSVVRGTTTRGKIGALRRAGAREIHLRVASPPIRGECYFGIDFPDRRELIATGRSLEQIRQFLEVDSLAYLSLEGLLACALRPPEHYCTACFSEKLPMPVDAPVHKLSLER